jgi:cytochrome c
MHNFRFKFEPEISIRNIFLMFTFGLIFFVNQVHAENSQLRTLMLSNNCMACHMIDKPKYGPQFNRISEKHKNDNVSITNLANKIKMGSAGVWGEDVMPPQPQVSDTDAKKMAELILLLQPAE